MAEDRAFKSIQLAAIRLHGVRASGRDLNFNVKSCLVNCWANLDNGVDAPVVVHPRTLMKWSIPR